MLFEHIQSIEEINKDKAILTNEYSFPKILNNSASGEMRPFIPARGCLFLSKVGPDGIGSWRKRCKKKEDYDWLSKPIFNIEVNFNQMNILVIDTPKQFCDLFSKYGIFYDKITYCAKYSRMILDEIEYSKRINCLLNYIKTFKPDIRNKLADLEHIVKILNQLKHRNTLIYQDDIIKIPKSGKTFQHFCHVITELSETYTHLYIVNQIINEYNYTKSKIKELNYQQIKQTGYNGIYFTQNLVNRRYHFCQSGESYFREFLKWLETDTLVIWNWCFNQSTILEN